MKSKLIYRDIAPGAAENATVSTTSASAFSDPSELVGDGTSGLYATLEQNQWALGGSRAIRTTETVTFWSSKMSKDDCTFEDEPQITVTFPQAYASVGISLTFDEAGLCTLVNIAWYKAGTKVADKDFAPNAPQYFCENVVEAYDEIVITAKKTALPYRYARLTGIAFGVIREFGMEELREVKITQEMHPVCLELPVSKLAWTLDSAGNVSYLFQQKQPVEAWTGNKLIGVFYIDTSSRTAQSLYRIDCKDAFGVLDDADFPGEVYAGVPAKEIMTEIVGADYEIDFGTVQDATMTGAILPMTRRAALQQLLFAWGCCAATDGGSKIRVFHAGGEASSIGSGRTYQGASVTTEALVTSVSVTAHSYTEDANGTEIGGVKYKDTQTVYTVENPDVTANTKANEKKITDAALVSPDIGQQVAQRVLDYYGNRSRVDAKIVMGGELLGQTVTVPTPWGDTVTGDIAKMQITLSNTVAAELTMVGG